MTSTGIGRPQISRGCPYKVLNSQWVTTRPEAMRKTKMDVTTLHINAENLIHRLKIRKKYHNVLPQKGFIIHGHFLFF